MNSSVNCAWQNVVVPNTTLCRRLRYNPTSSDIHRVRGGVADGKNAVPTTNVANV